MTDVATIESPPARRSIGSKIFARLSPSSPVANAAPAPATEPAEAAPVEAAAVAPAKNVRTPEEIFNAACRAIGAMKSGQLKALESELYAARVARQRAYEALNAAIQAHHSRGPAAGDTEAPIQAATAAYDRASDDVVSLRNQIAALRPAHVEMLRARVWPTLVANAKRIEAALDELEAAWRLADAINRLTEAEVGERLLLPQAPRHDLRDARAAASRFTRPTP